MAPDRRLVDRRQLELVQQQCRSSIEYIERELGLRTLHPPAGRALIRRLAVLRAQLLQVEQVLAALAESADSADRPFQH